MIKQFISLLKQTDLKLDYRQFEEALWLSRFNPKVSLLKQNPEPSALGHSSVNEPEKLHLQTPTTPEEKPVFPSGSPSQQTGKVPASRVRIAGAPPLPEATAISRAFRPFSRRFNSHQSFVLDEETTISQSAEVGFTFPAFRPAKERWFEVFLVVEDSPSMVVWQSTIRMLAQLLARHGAFRDVRVWKLKLAENKVQLIDSSGVSHQPGILRDPAGRRLLILLTDGVSAAWQHGSLANTLIDWGNVTPVVICQMLGESLWKSTLLGEPDVIVRATAPGAPNKRLEVERPWWAETFPVQESDSTQPAQKPVQLAIPIVSLKPELIEDWAKMLMGQGIPYSATLISASSDISKSQPRIEPLERMGPEEHLERFRALVSPETYGLACYLSWMPLTLPVIQLVHYRMIANRNQEQLAELLLGGILKCQMPSEPTGEVEYEFVDSVREKLQQEATGVVEQTFACVSEYVARQIGKPFDFLACLNHPQGLELLPAIARPFARVSIPGLRQLGLTHLIFNDLEEFLHDRQDKDRSPAGTAFNSRGATAPGAGQIETQALQGRHKTQAASSNYPYLGAPEGFSSLPPTFTNRLGMEFVLIPAGSFLMGSTDADVEAALVDAERYYPDAKRDWFIDEQPQHQVTFDQPFYLGKFQVNQLQWLAMMGNNPSYFKGDHLPVEQVSWDDCQEFLKKLNVKQDGYIYRLPSEAEWEYTCRAGTTTPFSFGETVTTDQVNYDGNYPYGNVPKGKNRQRTMPVGSFSANAWGLHQMHGNVWEWCQDLYQSSYRRALTDGRAWELGADKTPRVLRGGSWYRSAQDCRAAYRVRNTSDIRLNRIGFRVVAVRIVNA